MKLKCKSQTGPILIGTFFKSLRKRISDALSKRDNEHCLDRCHWTAYLTSSFSYKLVRSLGPVSEWRNPI